MSCQCIFVFCIIGFVFATVQGAAIVTPFSYAESAVGSTHQNVVRSFGGTVSHYSKAVDTPFSSVRKSDTRVNNNVYTPALARTFTYAASAGPTLYAANSAPAATIYSPVSPAHSIYETHTAPAATVTHYSPAATVAHVTFDGFGTHYIY